MNVTTVDEWMSDDRHTALMFKIKDTDDKIFLIQMILIFQLFSTCVQKIVEKTNIKSV